MENETTESVDSINDEEVVEETTEEEAEVEETEAEEEEEEEEEQEDDSEADELRARLEQLEKENKTLKIQKAKIKSKKEAPKNSEQTAPSLSKEEVILFARGLSEEEVEKVKTIAKLEGETPLVAAESDLFKLWKEKEDKKKETQETQLGASRGSVKVKPKKDFKSPELTPEEHKALWKKKMGR